MKLDGLPDLIANSLKRLDCRGLAANAAIRICDALNAGFKVAASGEIWLGPHCSSTVAIRHALELSHLLQLWPNAPVLAGLAAARTAALFETLENPPPLSSPANATLSALASETPLTAALADSLWPTLARHQFAHPNTVSPATLQALHQLWPVLGPTEWLMQTGGDTRLALDPATGLNGYGCSHRPRPWAVTFASSTASSSSERGYGGAEAMRCHILRQTLSDPDAPAAAMQTIRNDIAACFNLPPGSMVFLSPSGTDCELYVVAAAQLHEPATPVTIVLVAPEETGAGVPLAAAGRHFATSTARGMTVPKGQLIEGFNPGAHVEVVPLRNPDGTIRPASEVAAHCQRITAANVANGRRVVLHRVDVTKTGLLAPETGVLDAIQSRHPGQVDVVVDACQGRLSADRVQHYLARGWIVLLTGSKFLTGPPFAGAAIFPAAMRARFEGPLLPAGLAAYAGRSEFPPGLPAAAALPSAANIGLCLRWAAALAELHAFNAVPDTAKHSAIERFITQLQQRIASNPAYRLIPVPKLQRDPGPSWDSIGSILSFALRNPAGKLWLTFEQAREIYIWLNADLTRALPPLPQAAKTLASRRFHCGQPVKLMLDGAEVGALRISAGARLVSGEPSHAHLTVQQRLDLEISNACALLEKIELILAHLPALQRAPPLATYN